MSVILDFSIFPVDKGESVSAYVSRAVKVIKESGLPYKLGPMGTCIEGEWDEAMALVDRCFQALNQDCSRIYMTIKVDYRRGGENRMEGKIQSVERKA
ncbi:MAG: MTH1187 family thiamine-binding protein [Desulfatiglandales bacterium]